MGASDLPLGVRQRIEQRWSAQIKRLQQERDLKDIKARELKDRDPGGEPAEGRSDNADSCGAVRIAAWCKHRSG